jgi:glycosyltransferase involved in cell wall biosynthesis
MISFIVPAHNEQGCLARTLRAIHDSARPTGQPYEIIVVNDASTDATAEIAQHHNATVLSVNHRQIAATRNSGGRAANGERLFFVDADTTINAEAVASALQKMDKGTVGGGAPVWLGKEEIVPLYIRLVSFLSVIFAKLGGFTGGAFMFCTKEAFRATGGFNERLYWAEEGGFALALKREGRFVVLWKPVLTSGRRFRTNSGFQVLTVCAKAIFSPFKTFTRRASVQKIWYDSNRERDDKMPNSATVRISNAVALLIVLITLTGPLWNFIPWSITPLSAPLGKVRFAIAAFLCHLGILLWPLALVLFVNLLRQKRATGLVHSAALIAFCAWQGWDCILGIIWIWTTLGHWATHLYGI